MDSNHPRPFPFFSQRADLNLKLDPQIRDWVCIPPPPPPPPSSFSLAILPSSHTPHRSGSHSYSCHHDPLWLSPRVRLPPNFKHIQTNYCNFKELPQQPHHAACIFYCKSFPPCRYLSRYMRSGKSRVSLCRVYDSLCIQYSGNVVLVYSSLTLRQIPQQSWKRRVTATSSCAALGATPFHHTTHILQIIHFYKSPIAFN
jgi:hypothetical protein